MNEINCPECGKVFKIDENSYAHLLKQVRDDQFQLELESRMDLAEKDKVDNGPQKFQVTLKSATELINQVQRFSEL